MEFLVVPGPDGSVTVISAITGASEPVKVKSPTPKRSLTVPQGAKIAAFKICSIPAAA